MTKQMFVQQAYAAALKSSERSGMQAIVTVAQAALESNWGESKLSKQANNYFGIKAHGAQKCIAMPTHECENSKQIAITAKFAKYLSMLDCFERRDGILAHGGVYAGARKKLGDESAFIGEMAKHWATDPRYAEKLYIILAEVKRMMN